MKKIIAVNADQDFCTCCGKQGLKRVVWIEDTESGDISHFGTICAEKIVSYTAIKKASDKFSDKIKTAFRAKLDTLLEKHFGIKDRKEYDKAVAAELAPFKEEIVSVLGKFNQYYLAIR